MGNIFNTSLKASEDEKNFAACDSPNCVRCNKYEHVLKTAVGRLQTFQDTHPNADITRIEPCLMQIEKIQKELEENEKFNQHPNVFYLHDLEQKAWWLSESFLKDTGVLLSSFQNIQEEFLLLYDDLQNGQTEGWLCNNTPTGQWCAFHLINQGVLIEENCERCPETTRLLNSMDNLMKQNLFGNAMFSVLYPDTHITPHYGPSNLRIRCHLGLIVPEKCTLAVKDETRQWEEGNVLLFDDSFLHEARHQGTSDNGPRAVLMVDFWHPDICEDDRKILDVIFPGQQ